MHVRVARVARVAIVALLAASMGVPAAGAGDDAALMKDLGSVIALLGLSCGTVTGATRRSDSDHLATCSNGNRYRVYINDQGRAVAQKQ